MAVCISPTQLVKRSMAIPSLLSMAFSSLFPLFLVILFVPRLAVAQNSTATLPFAWTNSNSSAAVQTYVFDNRRLVRMILVAKTSPKVYHSSLNFGLCFYCNLRFTTKFLLAVIIFETGLGGRVSTDRPLEVVWMANRNKLVEENAVLRADPHRGMVLTDANGVEAFSTNVSINSATRMKLRADGDLVLVNSNSSIIWRSSNHPANTLLIGHRLGRGKRLTSSKSNTNLAESKFYLTVTSSSLTAYVSYKKRVAYMSVEPEGQIEQSFTLHSFMLTATDVTFVYKQGRRYVQLYRPLSQVSPVRLLRMDWDGGPRIYAWGPDSGWRSVRLLLGGYGRCSLPRTCGTYGVCAEDEAGCGCAVATDGKDYFTMSDPRIPNKGCSFADKSSTKHQNYQLVNFGKLSYFSYFDPRAAVAGLTELGACRDACERNSSCKAAFFTYANNASKGLCYLPRQVLTISSEGIRGQLNNSVAYIKVPIGFAPPQPSISSSPSKIVVALSVIGSICGCILISILIIARIKRAGCRVQDCYEQLLGGPTRFSYKELCSATGRFSTRLGSGGFGTVFKGEQKDGTAIAVKRLNNIDQGMDEFLAEMMTVGSIHHYNLVKLIGFCADESNKLLVYEYMSNGSLDKWIFDNDRRQVLNWEMRRRILLDVARGLAYLHEECSQRIAHLDMKPHNILLDENFNAKISDFGLARFIDRNQSHVTTGMRGTFGYLAPEWQHSRITVKADIYSFGIVVLEAVSGRLNLDYSLSDSDVHLFSVLQRKAREGRLVDIVDAKITDRESHAEDIEQMIRIGAWCLNEDQSKRPLMSTVVKILEGTVEMEHSIEFKFANLLLLSYTPMESCSNSSSDENYN